MKSQVLLFIFVLPKFFICVSGAGQIKRAKAVDNVLNHTSENDKKAKADMVAKIIDNEGARFGNDVLRKSKVMKETRQLNPEKTLGLMTKVRSSQYLFRQLRSELRDELGFSPISSQRKVDEFTQEVMVTKKEDWNFEKLKMYQNKEGKNKSVPTETPVLRVKSLESYVHSKDG